jgi:hypothetical protein
MAVQAGLTWAIVNAAKMKPYIMAADLLLSRDQGTGYYHAY